jgi:hypothetical protein
MSSTPTLLADQKNFFLLTKNCEAKAPQQIFHFIPKIYVQRKITKNYLFTRKRNILYKRRSLHIFGMKRRRTTKNYHSGSSQSEGSSIIQNSSAKITLKKVYSMLITPNGAKLTMRVICHIPMTPL